MGQKRADQWDLRGSELKFNKVEMHCYSWAPVDFGERVLLKEDYY